MDSSHSHVCPACKATEFEETEDGALSCVECGLQLQGVRQEVNEAYAGQGVALKKVKRARLDNEEVRKPS